MVPNLGIGQQGHTINLRAQQMINVVGKKKKKQSSDTHIFFFSYSVIFAFFCETLDTFTSLGLKQLLT